VDDVFFTGALTGVQVEIGSLKDQLKAIEIEASRVVGKVWPILQRKVSPTLKQLIQEDFKVKSRGGTGADGLRWKKLAQSTIDKKKSDIIGIEHWDMYDSLRIIATRSGETLLEVSYQSDHAEFFAMDRPLFPEGDVPKWIEAMEPLVEEVVTQNIQRLIDSKR
jgi:hypothetical protein